MDVKRLARRMIEKALDVQVVPVGHVALIFEWEHLRRLFEHFAIDCVFDIGANAGQYATMLRTRVGYRGPIVSYERFPSLPQRSGPRRRWTLLVCGGIGARRGRRARDLNVFASDRFSSLHSASTAAAQQFHEKVTLERRIEVRTATLANEFVKYQTRLGFKRPF